MSQFALPRGRDAGSFHWYVLARILLFAVVAVGRSSRVNNGGLA